MNYYHIDKDTLTIISGPHAVRSTYIKMLTGCGNPECLDLLEYSIVPQIFPIMPAGHRYAGTVVFADRVELGIEPLPAEELAACIQVNVEAIKQAGKDYIFAQIDPDGLELAAMLDAAGHPYGTANKQWLISIRIEQYRRMAVVEAGVEDFTDGMLDFSSFGDKPYTVQQMMMAAGIGAQGELS